VRVAAVEGRLALVGNGQAVDVAEASGGRFDADPQAVYDRWEEFREWAGGGAGEGGTARPLDGLALTAPVPRPRQVFAIGVNYADHAAETAMDLPEIPLTFTKFPSCLTGPDATVALPSDKVDWEVEMVVVLGAAASAVEEAKGWDHVAGVTVGQDLSERRVPFLGGGSPQFSLGKSYPGFGPIGPVVTTPDELPDRDDLELGCRLNGERVQFGRTRQLIYTVPSLIHRLSAVVTLYPGDLIFTGTPAGVGFARDPQVFLKPGDVLESWVEGVGTLTTRLG
jgi:2,4-didehydro-3-deoxy-L-rhamnonate hydrolase